MGYYTRYRFDHVEGNMARFLDALNALKMIIRDYAGSLPSKTGEWSDRMKWYAHNEYIAKAMRDADIKRVELHGEGEEQGDVWDKIYTLHDNGLVRVSEYKYQLVRPDFTTGQLDIEEAP